MPKKLRRVSKFSDAFKKARGYEAPNSFLAGMGYKEGQQRDFDAALDYIETRLLQDGQLERLSADEILQSILDIHRLAANTLVTHACVADREDHVLGGYRVLGECGMKEWPAAAVTKYKTSNSYSLENPQETYGILSEAYGYKVGSDFLKWFAKCAPNHPVLYYIDKFISGCLLQKGENEAKWRQTYFDGLSVQAWVKQFYSDPAHAVFRHQFTAPSQIHHRMALAGLYTPSEEAARDRVMKLFAMPEDIADKMQTFAHKLVSLLNDESCHPFQIAAFVKQTIVQIHPFTNGNGRVARLYANAVLMCYGYPPALLEADPDSKEKSEYYKMMETSDENPDVIYNYISKRAQSAMIPMLCDAARHGNMDEIMCLLQLGAQINFKVASTGATPLHYACEFNNINAARVLIGQGALIHTLNAARKRPLEYCQPDIADKLRLLSEQTGNDCEAVGYLSSVACEAKKPEAKGVLIQFNQFKNVKANQSDAGSILDLIHAYRRESSIPRVQPLYKR